MPFYRLQQTHLYLHYSSRNIKVMNVISLQTATRPSGKGAARAVRRQGLVPCVLYGHNEATVAFATSEKSLLPLIYTNRTHRVQIDVEGKQWDCILKDVDFHPVTDRPMHADFQVLQPNKPITISVPVRYVGTSIGQSQGGIPRFVLNELFVSCMPRHIPAQIDVDVTDVDIGQAIHVRDLELENLEVKASEDQILMAVTRSRMVLLSEEEEEVEEEEEEVEE